MSITWDQIDALVTQTAADLRASGRDDWLAERLNVVGASESPSILGVGYETRFCVWARKVGLLPDDEAKEIFEFGHVLQPAIIELLRRKTGLLIRDEDPWTIRRHPHLSWMGCSLDADIAAGSTRRSEFPPGYAVVECKNVGAYNGADWKGQEPPLRFNVQIQQQMAVTGATWGIVVGLIGGNKLVYHVVHRDDTFIDRMVRALGDFWELVEAYRAGDESAKPPVDDTETLSRALARMYPRENGDSKALPAEATEFDAERVGLKEQIKTLETRERWLDNWFKAEIGEASEGLLPGGGRYTLREQTRKEYVCPESTFRVLRRSAK